MADEEKPNQENPNPFDIELTPVEFTPALSDTTLTELSAYIAANRVDPQVAAKAVEAIEKAMQEKKSATEILGTVVKVLGGVAGIVK